MRARQPRGELGGAAAHAEELGSNLAESGTGKLFIDVLAGGLAGLDDQPGVKAAVHFLCRKQ